jgi:hypothetical protein
MTLLVVAGDVIAKVPVVDPDGTTTVAGTEAEFGRSEVRATEKPD